MKHRFRDRLPIEEYSLNKPDLSPAADSAHQQFTACMRNGFQQTDCFRFLRHLIVVDRQIDNFIIQDSPHGHRTVMIRLQRFPDADQGPVCHAGHSFSRNLQAVRFPALSENTMLKVQGLNHTFRPEIGDNEAEHVRKLDHIRYSRLDRFKEPGPEHGVFLRLCLRRLKREAANAQITVSDGKNAL